jgi:hypothetical protein
MYDEQANRDLEMKKLSLESERLILEQSKARWTAASVIGPFVVAAVTVMFSTYTQLRQADIEFQTKAIELILQTDDANDAIGRARMIGSLFPERVQGYSDRLPGPSGTDSTARRELVRLATAKATSAADVVRVWNAIYPSQKLGETFVPAESKSRAAPKKR